jgi:hypothetical protein
MGLSITNGFCQTAETDSIKFRRFDIFPAFGYSPETNFTLGALFQPPNRSDLITDQKL